jgi:hypothetical protein
MVESMMKRGEMPHIGGAICTQQQQYLELGVRTRHRRGKNLADKKP